MACGDAQRGVPAASGHARSQEAGGAVLRAVLARLGHPRDPPPAAPRPPRPAGATREPLALLLRVFPARTCSAGVFKRAGQIGRPCLLGYIGKCSAPCVGTVSAEEHRAIVDDFCDFMAGRTDTFVKRLEREMTAASEQLEFERAARLRDDIGALRR